MGNHRTNILFIVWDTCRLDYVQKHAPNLMNIADSSIWFENAIAPANWTNPSHSSMFSGKYPHKHGITQSNYMNTSTDSIEILNERGYNTYCVSSNNHFTHRTGFTDQFDESYYTRHTQLFPDGLNVRELKSKSDSEKYHRIGVEIFLEAAQHKYGIKSLMNLFPHLLELVGSYASPLKNIPHPIFDSYENEKTKKARDTARIEKILTSESSKPGPFFLFNNSSHLHYPYVPSKQNLIEKYDWAPKKREIRRLNREVAQNRVFNKLVESGSVDQSDIDLVRKLYATTVTEIDEELSRIISTLKETGQYDNTVIIVLGDHGENLGEKTYTGKREFGHGNSISDYVCRVPVVLFHPKLSSEVVSDPFSLKDIYHIVNNISKAENNMENKELLHTSSTPVLCEFPAAGGESAYRKKYPEVQEKYIKKRTTLDYVAAYSSDSRVIMCSDGNMWSFDHKKNPKETPDEIHKELLYAIRELQKYNPKKLDKESVKHLEEMGYM